MKENEARLIAVRFLESKGYEVADVTRGQGRPKLSIVRLDFGGNQYMCSIKVANKAVNGRISYPRRGKRFSVLNDVDLVLHVRPMVDGSVRATMFEMETVLEAFEKGQQALANAGKEHLPVWVSPEPESGWRQVGSGFGKQALWSETISLGKPSAFTPSAPDEVSGPKVRPLSITEAKLAVAAKYDVPPENIEIIVRG